VLLCGIDACSPNEVKHAVSCGFSLADISFTATSLSKQDFAGLARFDDLLMDCDSLHAIRSRGEHKPGSDIGIRINPAVGTGRACEVEPGDYICKDAGLLLLGKTHSERKRDTLFVGVDAGFLYRTGTCLLWPALSAGNAISRACPHNLINSYGLIGDWQIERIVLTAPV